MKLAIRDSFRNTPQRPLGEDSSTTYDTDLSGVLNTPTGR
jgi:hypothetical protein